MREPFSDEDLRELYRLAGEHARAGSAAASKPPPPAPAAGPPGGATALIAVIGGPKIHALGFLYALVPAALGALVLLAIALAVNNLAGSRKYPEYWW